MNQNTKYKFEVSCDTVNDIMFKKGQHVFSYLYGSQNYGMDGSNSDVDTKHFYLPTPEDMFFNIDLKTHGSISGIGNYEVKNFQKLYHLLCRPSINTLEMFTTEYINVNPKFQQFFSWLRENIDNVVAANGESIAAELIGRCTHVKNSEDNKNLGYYGYYLTLLNKYLDGTDVKHLFALDKGDTEFFNHIKNNDKPLPDDFKREYKANCDYMLESAVRREYNVVWKTDKDFQRELQKNFYEVMLAYCNCGGKMYG